MLRADLENERETVGRYRERIRQAEAMGEFALSETLREITVQEQEHEIDLSAWPGEGYTHEGETFCCQGCAEGTGCTCSSVAQPGFSGEGQKRTQAETRLGEQRAGALAPQGEFSGERDTHGTEEAIDEPDCSSAVANLK